MDPIQKAKHLNTVVIFGLFSFLPFLSSCEKKRQTEFVQGDGKHLYSIEDLSSKAATLHTGERLKDGIASVTTSTKLVGAVDGQELIVTKDIVSFELNDDPITINSKENFTNPEIFS